MTSTRKQQLRFWQIAILLPLFPVFIVFAVVVLILFVVSSVCLHLLIWSWWCLRGRDILFVYSDSPTWHDYVERHILPYLGDRAIVLNWSERKRWRPSLARMVFRHFGGSRQFNPIGIVFRPLRRTRTFRFWKPFQDYKHGHSESLREIESDFFRSTGIWRPEVTI
jgi:hypothetical protein